MGDLTGIITPLSGAAIAAGVVPSIISQFGVPVVMPPGGGTIGNNGALTLSVALPATFANCWMYFPATAINGANAAGIFYTQMSSTTVGTIYQNTLATTGAPGLITSPTAWVSTGPGVFTQIATTVQMLAINIPGGALGNNGALRYSFGSLVNNTANAKALLVQFGGTTVQNYSLISQNWGGAFRTIRNVGSQSQQIALNSASSNTGSDTSVNGSAVNVMAVNTATAQTLTISFTCGTAGDFMVLSGMTVEALYAP